MPGSPSKHAVVITERDSQLIQTVFLLRAADREVLQELYFTSLPRCNQRLMFLARAGYLIQYKLGCIAPAIYTCGKLGLPIALSLCDAEGIALTTEDIRLQCRRPSLSLLEHALDIGRVYASFRRTSDEHGNITFGRFLPERHVRDQWEIRRTDQHPKGQSRFWREVFAPDGAIRLQRTDSSLPLWLFLEVDRGCTNGQFQDKLRTHGRYIAQGLAAETYGQCLFKTAVITTSERRAAGLAGIACEQSTSFAIVTTLDSIKQCGPFTPIWLVPGDETRRDFGAIWEAEG